MGCFVLVAALGATVLALAFEFADESAWWAELARYVPYPVYLLPALLAVGASLLLGWRWRIAGVVTLALVLGPIMGLTFGAGERGSGRLRVLTYNVKDYVALRRTGGFAEIAWEIALHDPDIVVMQDADKIADMYRGDPKRTAALFGNRHVKTSGQFIIASRLPLRDCRDGDVSFPGERHHYQRCTVVANGMPFELFNVHLLTPRAGLNATRHERLDGIDEWRHNVASRMFQARALARDVAATSLPVLLMGDLNAPEHSPVVRGLLGAGLRSAWATAGVGYGYTYGHSLRPHISFARIDHVLASPRFGVADVQVGGAQASEHRPVITDLWLQRE
jgi:endonuclease/exonuclease/phosphatase family metal-dependent hydrolase